MHLPERLGGLMHADAYPHAVRALEVIETHVSWVILTGEFAYKIKRPVRYPFVDLRSAERRAFYCDEELRLNRRFAPDLYLAVCEIREENGRQHLGGSGAVIEHCVKMRQFDRQRELDRLLAAGQIGPDMLDGFGADLAEVHAALPVAGPGDSWGSSENVRQAMLDNLAQYEHAAAAIGSVVDMVLYETLEKRIEALSGCIDARRTRGRVRECHGDLHTRNILCQASRLIPFDCMEFEPAFRWIDVAEEIALLIADLQASGHSRHAHAFLSGYLMRSGDFEACRVLDLYKAHRALVRAKVAALEVLDAAQDAVAAARARHDANLNEARRSLETATPSLVLMTGLSGSGKTWLARRLAPDLGAIHLRSDVERKRLAGLAPQAQSGSRPGERLYAPEVSAQIYQHLERCAEDVIAGGYTALVDATFLTREQRAGFRALAIRLGVRMQVILCDAPKTLLRKRLIERQRRGGDASEADIEVLDWQLEHHEPISADESLNVVKVSASGDDVHLGAALRSLHGAD